MRVKYFVLEGKMGKEQYKQIFGCESGSLPFTVGNFETPNGSQLKDVSKVN